MLFSGSKMTTDRFSGTMLAATLAAALAFPTARTMAGERPVAMDWNSQVTVSHLPASGLRGTQDGAALTDYRFRLTRAVAADRQSTLSLGGGYGLKQIDAPAAAALPPELHSIFLEGTATFRFDDRSFATLTIAPGIYSDFGAVGNDDLRMPILALGGYRFDSGVTLTGGFIYRLGYHAARFIPAIGASWQPNEQWRLDLIMPRPGVYYSPSRQVRLFAGGDFTSDEYQLKDGAGGASAVRYGDYKLLTGAEYRPAPHIRLSAAAGYAFERRFAFFDGPRQDMRLDDAPFMRFGVDFGW